MKPLKWIAMVVAIGALAGLSSWDNKPQERTKSPVKRIGDLEIEVRLLQERVAALESSRLEDTLAVKKLNELLEQIANPDSAATQPSPGSVAQTIKATNRKNALIAKKNALNSKRIQIVNARYQLQSEMSNGDPDTRQRLTLNIERLDMEVRSIDEQVIEIDRELFNMQNPP